MLTIAAELLHGTIRASSADDLPLTGTKDEGDWPPSPARLFSAFVAADGTGSRMRQTSGRELHWIEQLPPPTIIASAPSDTPSSEVNERFVPRNERDEGVVQGYPARKAVLVRPGTRRAPRIPKVTYMWAEEPDDEVLAGLQFRAARIGYLGCADSPARITVTRGHFTNDRPDDVWVPDPTGSTSIPVFFPGLLEILDHAYEQWCSGVPTRRSWFRTERARYRVPGAPVGTGDSSQLAPTCIWLQFDGSLPGAYRLDLAETLKAAVLDLYQRHVLTNGSEVPQELHGHAIDGRVTQPAWWVPLPAVGNEHATGRLHGAVIMLPSTCGREVVNGVRSALWHLRTLTKPGRFEVGVHARGDSERPWSTNPMRWTGPSRRWVTASPVVHERRSRKTPTLETVTDWCRHAGYPDPLRFLVSPIPLLTGAPGLRGLRTSRRAEDQRTASHLTLEFDEPVVGPVVLGRTRSFGLGLMAPVDGAGPA